MGSVSAIVIRSAAGSHKIPEADYPIRKIRVHGDSRIQNCHRDPGPGVWGYVLSFRMYQFSNPVHRSLFFLCNRFVATVTFLFLLKYV